MTHQLPSHRTPIPRSQIWRFYTQGNLRWGCDDVNFKPIMIGLWFLIGVSIALFLGSVIYVAHLPEGHHETFPIISFCFYVTNFFFLTIVTEMVHSHLKDVPPTGPVVELVPVGGLDQEQTTNTGFTNRIEDLQLPDITLQSPTPGTASPASVPHSPSNSRYLR